MFGRKQNQKFRLARIVIRIAFATAVAVMIVLGFPAIFHTNQIEALAIAVISWFILMI